MPVRISCPSCATRLKAPDHLAGHAVPCPKCKKSISVPGSACPVSVPTPITASPPPMAIPVATVAPQPPVASVEPQRELVRPSEDSSPARKSCPFCAEDILASARKCKHCGEALDPTLRAAAESQRESSRTSLAPAPARRQEERSYQDEADRAGRNEQGSTTIGALGNLLWICFGGGLFIFLGYLLGGLILCATVIGIPFGLQNIKLATLGLMPFDKRIVFRESASGCLSTLMNVLWLFSAGLGIAMVHVIFAVACGLTIIGIPFAVQHMKMVNLALMPFGKDIR